MDFDTQELIIIGAAVAVVVLLAVLLIVAMVRRRSARRDHTQALRRQFGDDYGATVARLGRKPGEAELDERMHRFREMELERVSPDSRDELTEQWKVIQYRFLEDPAYSVRESEHLISALMRERGFPDGGFETRARALSMAHAELADPYREAYATFRATEDGSVTVGEMFDAMQRYRGLFESLLERPQREAGVEGSAPPSSEPGRAEAAGDRIGETAATSSPPTVAPRSARNSDSSRAAPAGAGNPSPLSSPQVLFARVGRDPARTQAHDPDRSAQESPSQNAASRR